MSSRAKVKGTTAGICFRSIFNAPIRYVKSYEVKSTVKSLDQKQSNISHLELPLITAGAIFLKQTKVSYPSSSHKATVHIIDQRKQIILIVS